MTKDKSPPEAKSDDATAFVKALVATGQAAKADAAGRLPPGATHEIVGHDAAGLPLVVRRRMSAF